jgi:hypothetical protein
MRKHVRVRIDQCVTQESSVSSDKKMLNQFCCVANYQSDEFKYLKEKIERKYGFVFMKNYKRSDLLDQWQNIKDTTLVKKISQPIVKNKQPKIISEAAYTKSYKDELTPQQALERFYKLKEIEKERRLLEEVRNIDLL